MRIMGAPAFHNKNENPYNYLLYSNMMKEDKSIVIEEFSLATLRTEHWDILHFHWPESFLSQQKLLDTLFSLFKFYLKIKLAKIKKVKIVWTVHNLDAHERLHPKLEKLFKLWFTRQIDGFISLTNGGHSAVLGKHPYLKKLLSDVIFHGHYRDVYQNNVTKIEARKKLNVLEYNHAILYFGQIRTYKNVPHLIEVFKQFENESICLVIAGKPISQELKEQIELLSIADPRIKLFLRFISNDELEYFMNAADLVVLPYKEIQNSGSALLALSFNKPILVPNKGALKEISELFGKPYVSTYNDELEANDIYEAVQEVSLYSSIQVPLDQFEWDKLSKQTLQFYNKILDPHLL